MISIQYKHKNLRGKVKYKDLLRRERLLPTKRNTKEFKVE